VRAGGFCGGALFSPEIFLHLTTCLLPTEGAIPHPRDAKRSGDQKTLSLFEGAGNAGAPIAPAALRVKIINTQVSHYGHAGSVRHSPRNGFNGLFHALPGDRAFCHRHQRDAQSIVANLTPASRRQDHMASPSATRALVWRACCVHGIFRQRLVTIAKRPSCGQKTRGKVPVICPSSQAKRPAAHWRDGQIS
jgi:uncharacterized Zn-binding protein involved in type VI secretion